MIQRELASKIRELTTKFPIVTLTGPRQSGKSTLLRHLFSDYKYVSLEDLDARAFADDDPRGFLQTYPSHVIIDEAQHAPNLFSYLQTHVDLADETGMYLLAGSQNFKLLDRINQSLAGRTAILKLMPFSRRELRDANIQKRNLDEQIFTGFYPRIYDKDIHPTDYYPAYIETYVERDVRSLLKVTDLNKFVKFIRLCAGRIGQILNLTALANETGIATSTADGWLSVLEASYICYRLEPNFNNFNKRIIKSPKLYFYDTGLACNLLGISSAEQMSTFYMRGALLENLVINQFVKDALNMGMTPDLTYWRDSQGHEIDLISTANGIMTAYEIKSGATFHKDFFKNLTLWGGISGTPADRLNVIYCGNETLHTSAGNVLSLLSTY